MKRIVITGARGYIGAALARRLAGQGHALRLVSRAAGTPEMARSLGESVEFVDADLRDKAAWAGLMRDASAIVHLSARTELRAAEADPANDDILNVEPVRALVRAAANVGGSPKIVFASTVTIFGTKHENPANEQTPDCPCSVYDKHKVACESILRDAATAGILRACTLRLANVYGDSGTSINSSRGILNVMMHRALRGEALTVYGDGAYIRDFIHIDDTVEAFAAAVASDVWGGERYVIASGRGHSLAEAYRLIADVAYAAVGRRIEIVSVPEPADLHPIERRNFIGDSSLYQQLTGWRPRISLSDGIGAFFAAQAALSSNPT